MHFSSFFSFFFFFTLSLLPILLVYKRANSAFDRQLLRRVEYLLKPSQKQKGIYTKWSEIFSTSNYTMIGKGKFEPFPFGMILNLDIGLVIED